MPLGSGALGGGGYGGGPPVATPFDVSTGAAQGDLQPAGWVPIGGSHAFVLGSDSPGRRWRAKPGDFVELAQVADWSASVLRAVVHVRPPTPPAGGVVWTFQVLVDGVPWDSFTFAPGDPERTRADVGVRGGALGPAPHRLAFRLTLTAAPTSAVAAPPPHPNPRVTLSVTGASNPAHPLPVVLTTSTPHNLLAGDVVLVSGVGGNGAANGYWPVTPVTGDPLRLSLNGSMGSGAYSGGGSVVAPPHVAVTSSPGPLTEVELPGVYVCDVQQDASATRLVLLNRDPEPGDARAPKTRLYLEVADTGVSGPDLTNTDVRVFRAQAVVSAVPSPAGVVIAFAAPHGLGPQAVSTVTVTGAPVSPSPTVVTTGSPHGFVTGQQVLIAGAQGNVALNGIWAVTVLSSTSFSVPVASSVAYLGGGTVTGPVGAVAPVAVANVVGLGSGLNAQWAATVVDAQRVSVPFSPTAGALYVAGGSVTPRPRAVSAASGNGVTPITLTFAAPHGLGPAGAPVAAYVSDVTGNLAANGDWLGGSAATVASATTVTLPGTGSGAYAGGGSVLVGTMVNLALHAGSTQSGWSGSASLAALDAGLLRVTLTPSTPLVSDAPHYARVVANVVGAGVPPLVTLYAFGTDDDLPPAVLGAVALSTKRVQVGFYEPVLQVSASGPSDALNPANYALSVLDGLPAVTPTVLSVAAGYAPNNVVLTLSIDATRAATYEVTVSGVADLVGNAVAAPTNSATFAGWGTQVRGRDFSIWDWWPVQNQLEDRTGELRAFLACFQEVADLLLGQVDGFLDILDPDAAPAEWLPSMLADAGNPFSNLSSSLSSDDMRRLVHALVPIYRLKGTDAGIVQALNFFLGIAVTVTYEAWGGPGLGLAYLSGPAPNQGGPAGLALRLGAGTPVELMTFFVNVPGGLTAEVTRNGQAIVQYMRRAGTRPVWRPPQPSPVSLLPLGEFTLGPGGTWRLL